MNTKRLVLGLIVVMLAFSVGFVTFKAAELFKSFVLGSDTDCSQSYNRRNCSQAERQYRNDIPLR